MFGRVGQGHFGGALSCADIVAALYFHELRLRPEEPDWPERDRFIMSKGHGAPSHYIALGEKGFFPKEWWEQYEKLGAALNTHPNMLKIPGVDFSAGSLGHGLSVGVGMALAARQDKRSYRTYVLLGDGECNEGSVWEAAMCAAHYHLDNLVAIVDRNYLMVDGCTEQVMGLEPLEQKWNAFGWCTEVIDGHDLEAILNAFDNARKHAAGPYAIIANTVKGKGVSFMEGRREWHGNEITPEELTQALRELEGTA